MDSYGFVALILLFCFYIDCNDCNRYAGWLCAVRCAGNKKSKEITESMAMVAAVWRLLDRLNVRASDCRATVYVLGWLVPG